MARLITTGFEENTTGGAEGFTVSGANPPTISTNIVRTGSFSLRQQGGTGSTADLIFATANGNGPYFFRIYFYIATLPSAGGNPLIYLSNLANNYQPALFIGTDGTLTLQGVVGGGFSQIGSASQALNVGQWYRLEMYFFNNTGSGSAEQAAWIDGKMFASQTTGLDASGIQSVHIGNGGGTATEDFYYDDFAINDGTGSNQTGLPGPGRVLTLRPNAAGDVNTFATQTGGTAGSANNFTRVNEFPPDDATTFNGSSTLNQNDLFNMDNGGLVSTNVINCVQVNARFRNSTADATARITFKIEKTGSGTKTSSSAIGPNTTTWNTNSTTTAKIPVITTYADPDGAAWTNSTIDSMQTGYTLSTGPGTAGRRIDVTAIWANVDYNDAGTGLGNKQHLYLQDAAPTFSPSSAQGTWSDVTNQPDVGGLFNVPSGASTTLALAAATATNPWDVLLATWDGAVAAQVIQGTVNWVFGVQAGGATSPFATKIHIWVSVGSTTVVRGTLLNNKIGTSWPTTAQGLAEGPFVLTPVVAQANDCIVIEVGYRKTGTNATSQTGTIWFGSNALAPDLWSGDTDVTNHPSWIEFSNPIQMQNGTFLGQAVKRANFF